MSRRAPLRPVEIKRSALIFGATRFAQGVGGAGGIFERDADAIAVLAHLQQHGRAWLSRLHITGEPFHSQGEVIDYVAGERRRGGKAKARPAPVRLPCWERTADELLAASRDRTPWLQATPAEKAPTRPLVELTPTQHGQLIRKMLAHRWPRYQFLVRVERYGITVYYPSGPGQKLPAAMSQALWYQKEAWFRTRRQHKLHLFPAQLSDQNKVALCGAQLASIDLIEMDGSVDPLCIRCLKMQDAQKKRAARSQRLMAITLYQPYATFVALGYKTIETRSRPTSHRGPLAIHAGLAKPRWWREVAEQDPFISAALVAHGLTFDTLPCGGIVAVCDVIGCQRFTAPGQGDGGNPNWLDPATLSDTERACGDYTPDRYGWRLANVRPLLQLVPARGSQSLWPVSAPDQALVQVMIARGGADERPTDPSPARV